MNSLSPRGKRNTLLASNAPIASPPAAASAPLPIEASLAGAGISATPSATRAQMRVTLSSEFSGSNPLAGQAIFVSRKPMDQILRELGVTVPADATPAQAMKALQTLCHSPQGCTPMMQKLPAYYVATVKLDAAGKATLSTTTATGRYYFFAITPAGSETLMWDVPAALAAGDKCCRL